MRTPSSSAAGRRTWPSGDLGLEFWAEPGGERRVFKVYEHGQVLDEWAAMVGSARTSHGLVWYLCELAG